MPPGPVVQVLVLVALAVPHQLRELAVPAHRVREPAVPVGRLLSRL